MNLFLNNEKLYTLLENLYTIVGIQTNIYELDGKDIDIFGKHCEFCRMVNQSEKGHNRCCYSDLDAVKTCSANGKSYHYRCHANLNEVIIPIYDNGEIIAFISFGQFLDEGNRKEQWLRTKETLSWYDGDLSELEHAFSSVRQISAEKISAYEKILESLASYIQLDGIIRSTNITDLQRLEMYINDRYTENLSLNRISADLHIGTTKLCALAKHINGSTITGLISDKRIEVAKTLLLKENLSISEIAERVGFNDYNYFTKMFRKKTGVTPSKFRKTEKE